MTSSDRRERILTEVRELIAERLGNQTFVPGQSIVRYAGRVYDSEEVVNLVDSSLEFWLTAGRYADEHADGLHGLCVRAAIADERDAGN